MTTLNDPYVIELIRRKAYHPAMKQLYVYFPVVKKHILKNNGTRQEAEDIYQEALVIFCRKLEAPDFVLTCRISTYLFGVCRLMWRDELKKRNTQIRNNYLPLTEDLADEVLETDLQTDVPVRRAMQALKALGQKCQELLERFYFRGESMKTIAAAFGFASERVAKNQKYRCIEKAKHHLNALHHETV